MDGKGPYRIYDPGGSEAQSKEETSSYRQLLEENTVLRERMKGLKSLGDLLEESQSEALKLRKRVEELVRDNEALKSSTSSFASACIGTPVHTDTPGHGKLLSHQASVRSDPRECLTTKTIQTEATESSSHFELVNTEDKTMAETQTENTELASQLQRLESSFSVFAQESNPNQLLAHLGRMAVEFHTLSSKVQKNEQRTSLLQTLCEQLRQENNELRKKMEEDLQYRNRDLEQLRQENLKLREQVNGRAKATPSESAEAKDEAAKEEAAKVKLEAAMTQQSSKAAEKTPSKTLDPEVYEKKIRLLEKQRRDVLEVNKQWDIQWNSMKAQYEQKITDLRQRLADSQKAVQELEAEREQRQRDYDKKLLLAKSKIDNVQGEKECLTTETCELKQKVRYLQDQLVPLTKQREYQEKEIQRLNRALEEALNLHSPTSQAGMNLGEGVLNLRQQELHTQIAVLKEQVKIFEEDFQKERRDRERMNEEKEDLRRQVERLQGQMTNLTNQLHQAQNECQRERAERCKLERLQMQHNKQVLEGQPERRTSDPTSGSANGPLSPPYCGPFVQVGHQLEGWPIHFPPRMPTLSAAPGRDFQPVNPGFPWQTSFPQPRGSRVQTDTARAPPESAEAGAAGFGKRERQNVDSGKH
ncbi:TNFAIP3-interacting protein 1 isoform X1 [Neoarius graeffei]|uniref:TNFAIP3-interacting protein 1 isoform X1 n=1 Tax=Neoarius graeffei TaxID=443677 RepID=UPI00298C9FCA|nr:TNFAIP3-interacting protein 1 isoform X1 [Neoarius graeffei]XP_060771326.1 TNFAIP3-interacting protein 1 isoform X1 [Neoarius graeffei]XP_060771327.1 TNFAIP3-interacting protein 1 isoform X1 [Neoarius graeffei]XP_060771328.1 TNFAIP3-interacting protein 1 isoform X1 [Neoarius graeffei]XP_060771329.1 TNFAIP3-interacting protein 1 isoform X1 [Neoarius graeffei]